MREDIRSAHGERKKREKRESEERDPGHGRRQTGRGGADEHGPAGVREQREPDQGKQGDARVRGERDLPKSILPHE